MSLFHGLASAAAGGGGAGCCVDAARRRVPRGTGRDATVCGQVPRSAGGIEIITVGEHEHARLKARAQLPADLRAHRRSKRLAG